MATKKPPPERGGFEKLPKDLTLRRVGERADASDATDSDGDTLGVISWVSFAGYGVNRFDVVSSTNQVGESNGRNTILEEVLVSGSGELASVIQDCLVLRGLANLLEGRNGHRGEKADDDDHDHDFDEREALGGSFVIFHSNCIWIIMI